METVAEEGVNLDKLPSLVMVAEVPALASTVLVDKVFLALSDWKHQAHP